MENPAREYQGDVVLYCGPILRDGYDKISSVFEAKAQKADKLCMVLVTYGGDPDAAYRIARAANHHYENIEILIPDVCKSAGTLLCIGAHKLIFGDRGELGPLDIQLSKPDEMFDSMSGLDIIQALNALENQILTSFRNYLIDIRHGSQIRTKTAADIAAKLVDGLIAPIAAKIDPITLGEHQRAMRIAYDYGKRLNERVKSLQEGALEKLISEYPSHGFVIDRKEAASLFKRVEAPDESTIDIYTWARQLIRELSSTRTPLVFDIDEAFPSDQKSRKGIGNGQKRPDDASGAKNVSNSGSKSKSKSQRDEQSDAAPS